MRKLKINRIKKAIEESAIAAIQKICKGKSVKRNKITVITIQQKSTCLKTTKNK